MQGWVDVFTRNEYKNILVDNLRYCQENKGLELLAWCIMTSHVHLVIRAKDGYRLPDILRDFKKFTSKKLFRQSTKTSRKAGKNGFSTNSKHLKDIGFGVEIINQ